MRGEPGTKERYPITKDVLLQLLPLFDCRIRGGITIYTAFYLTFAGFLRVGEFIYIAYNLKDIEFYKWFLIYRSVRFHDDYIKLILPASKIDPFRQGVTLTITATGDDAYAVTVL